MALKRKRDSIVPKTSNGVGKTKNEVDDPKVHPLGTTLGELPYDIVNNILLKLPIKSVLICKCVCKSWHSIILDPHFAQMQFECAPIIALVRTHYSKHVSRTLHLLDFDEFKSNEVQNLPSDNDCGCVCYCKDSPRPKCDKHMKLEVKLKLPLRDSKMVLDTMLEARRKGKKRTNIACKPKDDKFDIVNSCNGLLCLCDPVRRNPLVVCNPIIGEFIRLPQSENDRPMRFHCVYSGFGYLKKTNEYKVIRIYMCNVLYHNGVVEMHTLGARSWRNIKYHGPYWLKIKFPTCLNGSIHWLAYNFTEVSILCFDLESETLNPFPCPSQLSSITSMDLKSVLGFGELKGSLYICSPVAHVNQLWFWNMKKYGDGQSWDIVLCLNFDELCYGQHLYRSKVAAFGGGILIHFNSRFFLYYDPQKNLFRFLEGRGTTSLELESIFHVPSLIRFKDVVKDNNIEVLNVRSRCATFKLREDKEVIYLAKYKADVRKSMYFWNFLFNGLL